jgi:SagB-type dehydrogenase family enzyme
MSNETTTKNRKSMQCPTFSEGMRASDQAKGLPAPPFTKVYNSEHITLTPFTDSDVKLSYIEMLDQRRSVRNYEDIPLTQAQLSFMLWSTQGIQKTINNIVSLRPVPSGGARHPFETYICIKNVENIAPGIYYYDPSKHIAEKLCSIQKISDLPSDETITEMLAGQSWATTAPVLIFYTSIPYKAEWRYSDCAHRVALIDLGHVGQNAMLSATALGLSSCCLAAYYQKKCDEILNIDGEDEFTVYVVSVGTQVKNNS